MYRDCLKFILRIYFGLAIGTHVISRGYGRYCGQASFFQKILAGDKCMRKVLELQISIGTTPISKISFDMHCRHELLLILMGLQHIYSRSTVINEICDLIKKDVVGECNDDLCCCGLCYW